MTELSFKIQTFSATSSSWTPYPDSTYT